MEQEIMVSGGGMIRQFRLPQIEERRRVSLEGAGMLCRGGGWICCSSEEERAIWRLDERTLTPLALFASGPQVNGLALCPAARRLYVLAGGADSVLQMDAATGMPLLLARAGVNPQRMALDGRSGLLAVAGGKSGSVLLFDAQNLQMTAQIPMPGFVSDVAFCPHGDVAALCMGESSETLLVCVRKNGMKLVKRLCGRPGALAVCAGMLYASVEGRIWMNPLERNARAVLAPGRAAALRIAGRYALYTDAYADRACAVDLFTGRTVKICADAADMVMM